jgi:serine/threonine protein kinase
MPLDTGKKLGPYEILERIGEGGMGEVYKARDSRLDRTVAIKLSKEQFGERFEREARTIAALNHPHVCQLYDVGPNYLVMEFIEGKPLEGPLPLDDAIRIAGQIADALEAAHEKGIVHRDLKPGNIVLRSDGSVKVLDFGLAKVNTAVSPELIQNSPTISMAATQAGVILGTAAYMSPEQARGKAVTPRADIWAFGVVLYEMVTGKRLFEGEDLTETLASVVKHQPDFGDAPVQVRRLLQSCLQKDPAKRLKAIGDWKLLLDDPREAALAPTKSSSSAKVAWFIAALALASAAAAFLYLRRPVPDSRVLKMSIVMPPEVELNSVNPSTRFKISPDGQTLGFIGRKGKRQIWIRPLRSATAQPLSGTDDVRVIAWSPDSKQLAFSSGGKLQKIDAAGGTPIPLGEMQNNTGIAWGPGDIIIFQATGKRSLYQVSAAGGMPHLPHRSTRRPTPGSIGSQLSYLTVSTFSITPLPVQAPSTSDRSTRKRKRAC